MACEIKSCAKRRCFRPTECMPYQEPQGGKRDNGFEINELELRHV